MQRIRSRCSVCYLWKGPLFLKELCHCCHKATTLSWTTFLTPSNSSFVSFITCNCFLILRRDASTINTYEFHNDIILEIKKEANTHLKPSSLQGTGQPRHLVHSQSRSFQQLPFFFMVHLEDVELEGKSMREFQGDERCLIPWSPTPSVCLCV